MHPQIEFFHNGCLLSKHWNEVSPLVFDVFVNGEDEHEHEEEASAAEEVPDVVPDTKSGTLSTEIAGGGKIQSWNLQVGVHMVFP